ncbi:uncharacterized protein LOC113854471 [Abrus precatorius]|uniref:Uncharacterized protein LOC113854471 n=1 Tax=Abrus precatorius TaxID=3816 RepID=A0A8B8KBW6_ABRPR|nr:uncharacterized protein LOC113854471 [Abrus precatorius]XP_027341270.1 uncharacterized protein LOC113854471 [Abrus precatorius]
MPPSPAFRCSPSGEQRSDSHKRGRSLESGLILREKDEDLALFSEMQSRERENFLLQSSDDLEDSFSTKLRHFSDIKHGISIPGRGETSDLLNADGDKNDYDWLLTPPDTPLFPSLDEEPPEINVVSRGRPRSKPISISRSSTMERSYKSSRGSASPNRLSSSPRSGNNTSQSRGRSSSVPNSSPTQNLQHATPTRRPSPPPAKPGTPAPRSSTPTPRRISTGSSVPAVSSGIRGTSPVKTSRGNSASPKIRAWQTNIPDFSTEAPPNLRTSMADRPASYVRGSSPASRNGRDYTPKFGRQSMSPTSSRSSSYFHSHDRDQFSSHSKGSVISSGDDDLDSLQSITVGSLDQLSSRRGGSFSNSKTPSISKKSPRMVSPSSAPKRSFDSALRQMDRKSPQNMFRPLLSSVPSTTFYVGKANSAQHSLVSRNSSITTSSNVSSDHGTSFPPDTEGSDHNQDDVASETEKILYHDVNEEVFSFDKIDDVDIGHEINDESVDVLHNKTRGPMIALNPTESEDSVYHAIDREFNETLETSLVIGDITEIGTFENTAICSHCGCHYEATDRAERNIRLCPECSRKSTLLRHIIPQTTLAVSKENSVISTDMSAEEKSSAETDQLTVVSELPQETHVGNMRFPLGEPDAEETQNLSSEFIHSQQSPLSSSLVERSGPMLANQLEVGQSGVNYKKPVNHSGDQQLYLSNDRSNLKADLLEGAGISVLLKRSSSSKGPVVQGRTFTATTISYDDLSFARNSVNSIRSSTGRSSYSTSSSVDFSSARHSDFRVQRQSSGRKLDVDYGYDVRIKPPSPGSSFSGMSNHSLYGLGFATQETPDNTECGNLEEIPLDLREMQGSENAATDVIEAASMGSICVKEDKLECHDHSRIIDACSSDLVSQVTTGVQPDDNSGASFPNHGVSFSSDNIEDHPNNITSVSNTETSVKERESFSDQKDDMDNSSVDGMDALVTPNNSIIEKSEIEGENRSQNNTGVDDDPSLVSKSTVTEFQEHSDPNYSNDCLTASVSEYSHGLEGSSVTVECQDGGNTRSLTLEEATDTILFCSSIIHDLAYKAATIAMEKEHSEPLEGSEPTVTILGKPNSDIKDSRSRTAGKRVVKPQKARPKAMETDVKSPSAKTENDESVDEPLTRNVGLPNKVDSTKPPNKLESKCNCIIM